VSAPLPANADLIDDRPSSRGALGRAIVRALQVFTEQMDNPDRTVAMRAATEVSRLSMACLRHGEGLALDWADDPPAAELPRPEPARLAPQPEPPPLDLPPDTPTDLTVEEWTEFTQFARTMGFDEGALDLARRSLNIPDAPAKTPPANIPPARDRLTRGETPRPVTRRRESEVARLPAGVIR
jgi:hypothetical protein